MSVNGSSVMHQLAESSITQVSAEPRTYRLAIKTGSCASKMSSLNTQVVATLIGADACGVLHIPAATCYFGYVVQPTDPIDILVIIMINRCSTTYRYIGNYNY